MREWFLRLTERGGADAVRAGKVPGPYEHEEALWVALAEKLRSAVGALEVLVKVPPNPYDEPREAVVVVALGAKPEDDKLVEVVDQLLGITWREVPFALAGISVAIDIGPREGDLPGYATVLLAKSALALGLVPSTQAMSTITAISAAKLASRYGPQPEPATLGPAE